MRFFPRQVVPVFLLCTGVFSFTNSLTILGVYGGHIDSLYLSDVEKGLEYMFSRDTAFKFINAREVYSQKLDQSYKGDGTYNTDVLIEIANSADLNFGVVIDFQRKESQYSASVYLVDFSRKKNALAEKIPFSISLLNESREVVLRLYWSVRSWMGLKNLPQQQIKNKKIPRLTGARLLYLHEIIKEDSLNYVFQGAEIEAGNQFTPQVLAFGKTRYLLFPGSRYLIHKQGLELLEGEIAFVCQDSLPVNILLPNMRIICFDAVTYGMHAEGISSFQLVQGRIAVHPLLGGGRIDTLLEGANGLTRGYEMSLDTISLPAMRMLRKNLNSFFSDDSMITVPMLNEKKAELDVTFESPEISLSSMSLEAWKDLGIDPGAVMMESESWSFENEFEPVTDETGCYLCIPDHLGP